MTLDVAGLEYIDAAVGIGNSRSPPYPAALEFRLLCPYSFSLICRITDRQPLPDLVVLESCHEGIEAAAHGNERVSASCRRVLIDCR